MGTCSAAQLLLQGQGCWNILGKAARIIKFPSYPTFPLQAPPGIRHGMDTENGEATPDGSGVPGIILGKRKSKKHQIGL